MLERPYTIADIPPDLKGSTSETFASDVYAISGSRKRKRSEIALAIDRQGVNIYNVCIFYTAGYSTTKCP